MMSVGINQSASAAFKVICAFVELQVCVFAFLSGALLLQNAINYALVSSLCCVTTAGMRVVHLCCLSSANTPDS